MKKIISIILMTYVFTASAQITFTDKESGYSETMGVSGSTNKMGNKIDKNVLSEFKVGITTIEEVIAKLGKPKNNVKAQGKTIVTYIYGTGSTSMSPINFVPILGTLFGTVKNDQTMETTMFMFDENNVLFAEPQQNTAGGTGETKSLVDQVKNIDIKIGN
jgi:hypothetical protein